MPHVSFKAKAETLSQRSGRRGAGFTLVEMLVAIGAVALVSVGLAAIFQTVGRTVTTGKRVSQLTQQAAILESQMREDFAKMTRDGFLVIRHQFSIDATSRRRSTSASGPFTSSSAVHSVRSDAMHAS